MIMVATVREVRDSNLLVCDNSTSQEVVVQTNRAGCFSVGDKVRICYSGVMTNSLPPQISAERICRVSC